VEIVKRPWLLPNFKASSQNVGGETEVIHEKSEVKYTDLGPEIVSGTFRIANVPSQ
jgi:hypothetical protein